MRELTDAELASFEIGQCPFCHCRTFYDGPRGGASQNIMCAGCGSIFNLPDRLHYPPFMGQLIERGNKRPH
jgi:hypothetical protein